MKITLLKLVRSRSVLIVDPLLQVGKLALDVLPIDLELPAKIVLWRQLVLLKNDRV